MSDKYVINFNKFLLDSLYKIYIKLISFDICKVSTEITQSYKLNSVMLNIKNNISNIIVNSRIPYINIPESIQNHILYNKQYNFNNSTNSNDSAINSINFNLTQSETNLYKTFNHIFGNYNNFITNNTDDNTASLNETQKYENIMKMYIYDNDFKKFCDNFNISAPETKKFTYINPNENNKFIDIYIEKMTTNKDINNDTTNKDINNDITNYTLNNFVHYLPEILEFKRQTNNLPNEEDINKLALILILEESLFMLIKYINTYGQHINQNNGPVTKKAIIIKYTDIGLTVLNNISSLYNNTNFQDLNNKITDNKKKLLITIENDYNIIGYNITDPRNSTKTEDLIVKPIIELYKKVYNIT